MSDLVIFVSREMLEGAARIHGPESPFAQALAAADSGEYGTDPVFYRPLADTNSLVVAAREEATA